MTLYQLQCWFKDVIDEIKNNLGLINSTYVIVQTYQDMKFQATGTRYKKFLVLRDESKNDVNITYEYWPNGTILWVINVQEN